MHTTSVGMAPILIVSLEEIVGPAAAGPTILPRRILLYHKAMAFYKLLADLILALHFAYVSFVLLGMAAILLGAWLGWRWVRNFWFRAMHLVMIAVVVGESLLGIVCPLTVWEDRLRELGGELNEPGSFITRWMDKILFLDVSPPVMTACYCAFAAVVLTTLIFIPPRWPAKYRRRNAD
jgi:polyferredoxin